MPSFSIFEVDLKKRGRKWRWCVSTTNGTVVMQGFESTRPAAKYQADRAFFLLLLAAAYRSRASARSASHARRSRPLGSGVNAASDPTKRLLG